MKTVLTFFFVLFLCGPAVAQDLPPDILADQYMLEATDAMEQGDRQKAERAFKKIEALEVEPPPMFAYSYGKLLVEHGGGVENWRKGQSLLKQFVISAGRGSEYYTPTLKLLSAVEAKLEAATYREAQRRARLPAILQQVSAQMVRIEGGTFTMGCTREQTDCFGKKPAHRVRVSSFELSKYEVTQEVWEAVMGENPSRATQEVWEADMGEVTQEAWEAFWARNMNLNCPQCPVESVNWAHVQVFLRKLNAGDGRYRLPSEAEWEYAARGGQQSRGYQYAGSNNPDAVAWYRENSGDKTHPVGQKQPNELGLYDMSGNVQEWVQDCWNYVGGPSDGRAWEQEGCSSRIFRGGSRGGAPFNLRSTSRDGASANFLHIFDFGFRLARSLP